VHGLRRKQTGSPRGACHCNDAALAYVPGLQAHLAGVRLIAGGARRSLFTAPLQCRQTSPCAGAKIGSTATGAVGAAIRAVSATGSKNEATVLRALQNVRMAKADRG